MRRVTTRIRIGSLLLAIAFAAAAVRPVRASESGNAVQRPRRRRRLRQRSNPQSRTLLYPSRSLPSTSAGKAGETAR